MSHLATYESDESTADADFSAFVGKSWGGDMPYSPKRQFCFHTRIHFPIHGKWIFSIDKCIAVCYIVYIVYIQYFKAVIAWILSLIHISAEGWSH